jgi:hypothetical protein
LKICSWEKRHAAAQRLDWFGAARIRPLRGGAARI